MNEKSSAPTDIRITELSNGVLIASESIPKLRSASIGVYLDIGSRDEMPSNNGIAHFFEHMVFKGTRKYSALEIVRSFEASGGHVNAYTSKEQTCFYAKVVDTEITHGLDLLLDMVLNATFEQSELEKEREVIIEEIKGGNDNPEEYIYDLFSRAFFGTHSLGYPIAGDEKTVRNLGKNQLKVHQNKARTRLPFYVLAVGRVDHREVVEATRKSFATIRGSLAAQVRKQRLPLLRRPIFPAPKHLVTYKPVTQANVILGGPGYAFDDERRFALLLLSCILGDGMSSRLFQNLREDHGLVYNIYSNPELLVNTGAFSIGFATEQRHLKKAMREICRELTVLKREGMRQEELEFAKRNISGSILLGLESTYNRMNNLARRLAGKDRGETLQKTLAKLNRVSLEDVNLVIKESLDCKKWGSAAIVPKKASCDLVSQLNF